MNRIPFDHREAMPSEDDGMGRRRFLTTSVSVGFAAADGWNRLQVWFKLHGVA
jgi:hypothetical protein